MTKISQLSDIGGNLAGNDEFIIRDVSDASTPNKKVTASGFFLVASALGLTGLDRITAGTVASGTQTRVYESGAAGYAETTVSGVNSARTTISGYFENASGTVGGTFFPVVTQTDIGTDPNQVPVCGMLGGMAFQSPESVSMGTVSMSTASVDQFSNVPLLTGGGLKFPPTQVASADPNTLDDYEEGTWTPTIIGTTTAGTVTYVARSARYTKIGRKVFIEASINWTAGTGAGSLSITGLPFPSASAPASALSASLVSGITLTAGHVLTMRVEATSTQIGIYSYPSGGGGYGVAPYSGTGVIGFSGSYTV
jgi:hypothetical protein